LIPRLPKHDSAGLLRKEHLDSISFMNDPCIQKPFGRTEKMEEYISRRAFLQMLLLFIPMIAVFAGYLI